MTEGLTQAYKISTKNKLGNPRMRPTKTGSSQGYKIDALHVSRHISRMHIRWVEI